LKRNVDDNIVWEIWKYRNKITFNNGIVYDVEIFTLAQLKTWSWVKFRRHGLVFMPSCMLGRFKLNIIWSAKVGDCIHVLRTISYYLLLILLWALWLVCLGVAVVICWGSFHVHSATWGYWWSWLQSYYFGILETVIFLL